MKQNILIAGLGLIGGSLAKALKQSREFHLLGFDTHEETLQYALDHHIVDKTFTCFADAALQADVIILAAPISKTIELMVKINAVYFDHDVIVTDVSSVKGSILKTAEDFTNEKVTFIGGHQRAESHKNGKRAAKAQLFEKAIYILTRTDEKENKEVSILKDVLLAIKSRFIIVQPDEHDEMTSTVSHVPHLIATSLVHKNKAWKETHAYLTVLSAGSFGVNTRIASRTLV